MLKRLLPYLLAGLMGAIAYAGLTFVASPTQGSISVADLAETKWGPNRERDNIVPNVIRFSTVDLVKDADGTYDINPGELLIKECDIGDIRTGDANDPTEAGYLVLYLKHDTDRVYVIRGPLLDIAKRWARSAGAKLLDETYSEVR